MTAHIIDQICIEKDQIEIEDVIFPKDDCIHELQECPNLFDKYREQEEIAKQHQNKLSGKINYLLPQKVYRARRNIIRSYLPAIIVPEILDNATDEKMQRIYFQNPIPYAKWLYIRDDLKKMILELYKGDEHIGYAYDPGTMWNMWNECGCFEKEHWDYIFRKRQISGELQCKDGKWIYKHNDDRIFRGWSSSVVIIGNKRYSLNRIVPSYYRSPGSKKNAPNLLERIKSSEDILPSEQIYTESKKELAIWMPDKKKLNKSKEIIMKKKSFDLSQESEDLKSPSDLFDVDSLSSSLVKRGIFKAFETKKNDVCYQRDRLIKMAYNMNSKELQMLNEFASMVEMERDNNENDYPRKKSKFYDYINSSKKDLNSYSRKFY